MENSLLIDFLFRWLHVLFALVWVGLLYYFNFVQGEYLKEATVEAKSDVVGKLAPRALWWFRWAAVGTFATGVYMLVALGAGINQYIAIAALMGTLMFLNVWLIIWPNQRVVCGLKSGDVPAGATKALLASRTNVLFSAPMLFGMLASKHGVFGGPNGGLDQASISDAGFLIAVVLVLVLEANAVIGELRQLASVSGVIHMSIILTGVIYLLIHFL